MNDATLSAIIPAHNAASSLEALVAGCLALMPRTFADIEIIIVDDGSTDDTPRIADRLAASFEPVVVLHQRAPIGYGPALAQGIAAARGDYIAVLPADAPRAADDLARLAPSLDRAEVVASTTQGQASAVYSRLLRDWPRGAERGPLLARADVLRGIPITSKSQLAHAEILYCAHRGGHAVAAVELPDASAPSASLGELIAALRLKAQAERNWPVAKAGRPWQRKMLLGGALAALLGGAWAVLRRR